MKGFPIICLLVAGLAAMSLRASAAGVPVQAGTGQVQNAPGAVTAAAPTGCCCGACPHPSEAKPPLIMDPAVVVALIGLFGAGIKLLYDRRVKRRTLNIIILAEIIRLLRIADRHYHWWKKAVADQNTDQQLIPFTTPIFDSQLANLGDLDPRYASDIVRFYGYIKFLNSSQESQAFYLKKRRAKDFDTGYLKSLQGFVGEYKTLFSDAFEEYGIKNPYIDAQESRRNERD